MKLLLILAATFVLSAEGKANSRNRTSRALFKAKTKSLAPVAASDGVSSDGLLGGLGGCSDSVLSLVRRPGLSETFGVRGDVSGTFDQEGDTARFLANAIEQPQYIVNQIDKLTPANLDSRIEDEWSAFKLTYNKIYPSAEIESFKKEVFVENLFKISRFNQEYIKGKANYIQDLNPYGDMLNHEFNKRFNGFNQSIAFRPEILAPSTYVSSDNVDVPISVDWRDVGAVTPVKYQGSCASCYAFAAAGALEAQWFRKTGQLVDISEQNIVDCSKAFNNNGCSGGLIENAFEYIKQNGGIDGQESYPYEERDDQQCRFKPENVVAQCTGYVSLVEGDEKGLEIAVATIGPIAVGVDATRFQFYSAGVFYEPECKNSKDDINHAVLIVGYGQEPGGQKYWLIKNSFGEQWGEGGYMKMAKDVNNHCGIATTPTYPLV